MKVGWVSKDEMIERQNRRVRSMERDLERSAAEMDVTFSTLRKVIPRIEDKEIRAELVALLPEAKPLTPTARVELRGRGLVEQVNKRDGVVRDTWERYGLEPPE